MMKWMLVPAMILAVAAGLVLQSTETATADAHKDKPMKVLLVLGGCCHDYAAQKDLLKEGLEKRANVKVTIAYDPSTKTDHLNPAYESDDWAAGYDAIVHDECSANVKDMKIIDRILKPHREGLPAVALHCAMHSFRSKGWNDKKNPSPWQKFLGLQTTGHGPQKPIDITYTDSSHPITRGLKNWTTTKEELYNNITGDVVDTAHVLARGKQGDAEAVVAWTNTFEGKARVFGTTIGHNNDTVGDDRYLDLVTNGLLWATGHLKD